MVQLGAQSLLNTHVHKSETPAEALRCRPHYYLSTLTGTGQTLHISHMPERLREGEMEGCGRGGGGGRQREMREQKSVGGG